MAYNSIQDLPSQVRASLDDMDCKVWMEAYNQCDPVTDLDAYKARSVAWRACRELPSSFSFKATCSAEAVDDQHEMLDLQSIKDHLDSFIEYGGPIIYEHGNYTVGIITAWEPEEVEDIPSIAVYGNLFGGDEVYDEMRKAFINGKNSLSVAGEADRGKFTCDKNGCYSRRNVRQILEISLCKIPSNKFARMQWYNKNAAFTKSSDETPELRLNVDSYVIHKDYSTCPIQALVRCLENIGYDDVHPRHDGAFVKMSYEQYREDAPQMNAHGLRAQFIDDGVYVRDEDAMIRSAFKKGVTEGWMNTDGTLKCPNYEQFSELFNKGLLTYDNKLKRPSTYKCAGQSTEQV